MRIENFSDLEMLRASQATDQFDVVLLFSTKWEPPHPLLASLPFGRALHERFFDYHEDMDPQRAAALLGGRVLDYRNRNNEWIAIISHRARRECVNPIEMAAKWDCQNKLFTTEVTEAALKIKIRLT